MKWKRLLVVFTSWLALLSISAQAQELTIPGTGASAEILKVLSQRFHEENPQITIKIPPSIHSSGGVRVVGKGEFILGRVARAIKESEKKYNLSYLPFCRDAVVFGVGSKINLKTLTPTELAALFSGKTSNWKEVGGPERPVMVLIR